MKIAATLILLITPFTSVTLADDINLKASKLLEGYHQAVRQAINPWKEDNFQEIYKTAGNLADEHVLQQKKELHELAVLELKNLEKRKYDLSQYETRFESDADAAKGMLKEIEEFSSGMRVYHCWNPIKAASLFKQRYLARHVTVQAFGTHAALDQLAPPNIYAVSAGAVRPTLAMDTGRDLCLVDLEYDGDDGFYKVIQVRFLTKK